MKKKLLLAGIITAICTSAFATTYVSGNGGIFRAQVDSGATYDTEVYAVTIGTFAETNKFAFELELSQAEIEFSETTQATTGTPGTEGTPGTPAGTFPGQGGGHAYGWWRNNGGTPGTPGTPATTTVTTGSKGSDLTLITLMANAKYRVLNDTMFIPYVGAGTGATLVEFDTVGDYENEIGFTYQVGGGVDVKLCDYAGVDANVRYIQTLFESDYDIQGLQGLVGVYINF